MTSPHASQAVVKVKGLVRDKNGVPKIDDDKLRLFWQYLTKEEQLALQDKYDKVSNKS